MNFTRLLSHSTSNIFAHVESYTRETVEHLILALLLYLTLCCLLYYAIIHWKCVKFSKEKWGKASNVLLVIAHPDDECMFFGPTVLHFVRRANSKFYVLCLSTGQNYGMGKTRKKELYKSCETLGINASYITIVNHSELPDVMGAYWPIEVLASIISKYLVTFDIDTLVTFDKHGVSGHANHSSIYFAIAHLTLQKQIPPNCSIYVLDTVNLLRKYWLLLDLPVTFLLSKTRFLVSSKDREIIHNAMKQHKSQLVWFRRLYMFFSRYMFINSLQLMELSDIELDLEIDD